MKVIIAGQAIVINSELKFEDIQKIKKYRPEALTLYEGEGAEREPVFMIGTGEASINKYGVTFAGATRDDAKQATLTITTNYAGDDIKGFVADELGSAIIKLGKLEEQLPAVLAEIDAQVAAIQANITISQ